MKEVLECSRTFTKHVAPFLWLATCLYRKMCCSLVLVLLLARSSVGDGRPFTFQIALEEFNSQMFIPNMNVLSQYLAPHFILNPNPLNPFLRFQCTNLFHKQVLEFQNNTKVWPPPRQIPDDLYEQFTYFNHFKTFDQYYAEEAPITDSHWSQELIEEYRSRNRKFCGPYPTEICGETVEKYQHLIAGKRGLILGSITPWAEAMLFNHHASELITVEYTSITTDYPNLTILTPAQLADLYLQGQWEPVDFIFTFSSLEHDGLGRYGDPINPWGDLETMARLHCLLRDDGHMFFGVPSGRDSLVWNAHRIYGRYRLRIIFQDWWILKDCLSPAVANDGITLLLSDEDQLNKSYKYLEMMWVVQRNTV
jgi:hypothetical protein